MIARHDAPDAPEQAVILVGGQDSDTPNALRAVGGRPFLDYLVETCTRFGFRDILLLPSQPGGTAGAIRRAADRLHERFLLLNGDSVFDFNWLDLMLALSPDTLAVMALRRPGLTDGGVYLIDRRIVPHLPEAGSLAHTVLPALAARGQAAGRAQDGAFLDIGSRPEALSRLRRRPAVFFDRDGTLNVDNGYTHRPQDLAFLPGAVAAVKRVNDLGYYAFLVTNQSGIARGYFTEADTQSFHSVLQRTLRPAGAHIDDFRYCPDHPEGTVARYRRASDWRKPAPGMLLDLMTCWPIQPEGSLVVGDKASDVQAAQAAGLRSLLYGGGDLDDLLAPHLARTGSIAP